MGAIVSAELNLWMGEVVVTKFTHWVITLQAGAILGAALWSKEGNYAAYAFVAVAVSWLYPWLDNAARRYGRRSGEWIVGRMDKWGDK